MKKRIIAAIAGAMLIGGTGVAVAAVPNPDPCASLVPTSGSISNRQLFNYQKCRLDRIENKVDSLKSPTPTSTTTTTVPSTTTTTTAVPTTTTTTVPTTTTTTATATSTVDPVAKKNCMVKPSDCGYPDATNTGVKPGSTLQKVTGSVNLTTPGQVYENKEVHGSINVLADNVTIRNVKIVNAGYYTIKNFEENNAENLVIEDVSIDMNGSYENKAIAFENYTARRVHFYNGMDCGHFGNNVVIEDSFCDMPVLPSSSDAHADGFQSDGGNNIVLRHNTIKNPNGQTAAILMSTNTSGIGNVTVDNNLMAGGGYTLYCDAGPNLSGTNKFTNNRFARTYFTKGGYWGPTAGCENYTFTGNVWDDTNASL